MPALVTRRFKIYNAAQFKEAFTETAPDHLYLFIGRVQAWPNGDTAPALVESPTCVDYDPWRDMIGAKKITANDMSFSIPRYNWTTGTVYDEYDNLIDEANKVFYVLTYANNVYKCIFNNRGTASTVEPTGTGTTIFNTPDGYRWKFMYTVTAAEVIKFVTPNYMPIKRLAADDSSAQWDVQQAAANGAIHVIDVTSNGSGYIQRSNTLQSVTNSSVVTIDSGASTLDNYYQGSTIFISSGLGAGQIRGVSSFVGDTKALTVDTAFSVTPNSTSTFHIGPLVTVLGDGTGATAYANVQSGQIKQINMVGIGTSYSKANVAITAAVGTGAIAVPRISPPGGHGSDPVDELNAHNLTLSVRLSGTEGNNLPSNNDFRVIGMLKNPVLSSNGAYAVDNAYDQTTRLSVINLTGIPQRDEMVNGALSGASARVVYFANTDNTNTRGDIKVVGINGIFQNEILTGNTSLVTCNVSSITTGELEPYKGDIMYLENRVVSVRTYDQIEDIKITLQY
tara:strand:+ start:394 stop:1920 length:1527 start_codon:yes stop_codon:yes gene_type:complete